MDYNILLTPEVNSVIKKYSAVAYRKLYSKGLLSGMSLEDFIQEAYIIGVEAVDTYDFKRSDNFVIYFKLMLVTRLYNLIKSGRKRTLAEIPDKYEKVSNSSISNIDVDHLINKLNIKELNYLTKMILGTQKARIKNVCNDLGICRYISIKYSKKIKSLIMA